MYLCKCECGNTITTTANSLKSGHTKSCGCLQKERVATHNKSRTRLYKVWMDMRSRCAYKKGRDFKNYGERGITVCDEWCNDFMNFYEWAMANGYKENAPKGECTLDRIDVNGDYCPKNCRFVSAKTQANNRTNNKVIVYHNESHTLAEWSEILGVKYETLAARLNKYKWSVEQAFSTKSLPRGWNLQNGKARGINTK
jgi:hypothetical protein